VRAVRALHGTYSDIDIEAPDVAEILMDFQERCLATDRDDMFRAEDREFLEAVAQDRAVVCTIAEARRSLEVVLAAQGGK
jgi:hypothetical protein